MASYAEKSEGILLGGCVGDLLAASTDGKCYDRIRQNGLATTFSQRQRVSGASWMSLIIAKRVASREAFATDVDDTYDEMLETYNKKGCMRSPKASTYFTIWMFDGTRDIRRTGSLTALCVGPYAFARDYDDRVNVSNFLERMHDGDDSAIDACVVYVRLLRRLLNGRVSTASDLLKTATKLCVAERDDELLAALSRCHGNAFEEYETPTERAIGYDTVDQTAAECFACALRCFYRGFDDPVRALSNAANFGGRTRVIAKLVGEMAGARYGCGWLKAAWPLPSEYDDIAAASRDIAERNRVQSLQRLAYDGMLCKNSSYIEKHYGKMVKKFVENMALIPNVILTIPRRFDEPGVIRNERRRLWRLANPMKQFSV